MLPELFVERLAQVVPDEHFEQVLASFAAEKPTTFRLNPLKGDPAATREELLAEGFTLTAVPWYAQAYAIPPAQRRPLTETAAFYDGRLYIQNLASMLAPLVLAPQPGEEVLDLAAAPGGKTLQLADLMGNEGDLAAVEAVKPRFFKLKANLAQHGANAKCYLMDGRAAGRRWPQRFDKVLLDAPCSSEARFRTADPTTWSHWSARKIKETAHKQKKLLEAAFYALRPGGAMLYCTCAFAPEENELVVANLLRKHEGEVRVEPITLPLPNGQEGLTEWGGKTLPPALAGCLRVLPTAEMDGFFLALLRKAETVAAPYRTTRGR